jgi:hypothetical protein
MAPSDGLSTRGRTNLLRKQTLDAERIRQAASRLRGQHLPDISLTTSDGVHLPLLAHVKGTVVLYLVPGEHEGATRIDGFPTTDASRHKAYVNCFDLFDPRQIRVFAVASQPILDLRRIRRGVGANHIMFADPELQLGRALDLPLSGGDESNRYPRLAIVASNGNILAVLPDGNARQVMAWIVAHQ